MVEKSLQPVLAQGPAKRPYVPWQPTIERQPEFNPFTNLVEAFSGIKAPTIH